MVNFRCIILTGFCQLNLILADWYDVHQIIQMTNPFHIYWIAIQQVSASAPFETP